MRVIGQLRSSCFCPLCCLSFSTRSSTPRLHLSLVGRMNKPGHIRRTKKSSLLTHSHPRGDSSEEYDRERDGWQSAPGPDRPWRYIRPFLRRHFWLQDTARQERNGQD